MINKSKQPLSQPNTLEVTNFSGALSRKKNGQINSGLAKFSTSFGYDPFSKPGQLTWLEQPSSVYGLAGATTIVAVKPLNVGNTMYVYALSSNNKLFQIQSNLTSGVTSNPNLNSVIGISSIAAGSQAFQYGGSIEFFNNKVYFGGDTGVSVSSIAGGQVVGDTFVGTAGNYTQNTYRPLSQFIGYLIFGNGNNIGAIDSTGTVISSVVGGHYEQLSPSLPTQSKVNDLDASTDGNYLYITTSGLPPENISIISSDRQIASASNGNIYYWNGIDQGATGQKQIPSYAVTALQTYLDNNMLFSNDAFGAAISNGSQKIVSLPNNKSPFANGTTSNGNFLTWMSPELSPDGTMINGSMYYYGNLDEENPKGLWRVLRYTSTLSNGFVYQTPVNVMVNNKYSTVNNAITAVITLGMGKHFFSTFEANNGGNQYTLQSFLITPTGTGLPQSGVFETQNQLFSKRISISEIRVYTEPTATGNGFQLDLIGSEGNIVSNGTFTYTYAAGTDITVLQGSLERINFNTSVKNLYSLGLRITNTGTTNMVINKIEIDWTEGGK